MKKVHFGFETIDEDKKASKVAAVFQSVAQRYDVMNDLMSFGLHRLWKAITIGQANVRTGHKVLDIAAGTGDLAKAFSKKVGTSGEVWLTDINQAMLKVGRDRLIDKAILIPAVQCDAEYLPFPEDYFDVITLAFGLRNMTAKENALKEMQRVLKPGGKLLILEFSKIHNYLHTPYELYSMKFLPWLGKKIANDADSYRYLAESIRMHPDQILLKEMMEQVGLERVQYENLSAGIVALHTATKF